MGLLVTVFLGLEQGLVIGLMHLIFVGLGCGLSWGLVGGLSWGLTFGLIWGMYNGGWFVLLQKVAYGRLTLAGNLPRRPYDFLDWGIEKQIFRRVGAEYAFATTSSSST